jgi:hypothetical protein
MDVTKTSMVLMGQIEDNPNGILNKRFVGWFYVIEENTIAYFRNEADAQQFKTQLYKHKKDIL